MANAGGIQVELDAKTAKFRKAINNAIERLESISGAARKVSVAAGTAFVAMSGGIALVTNAASEQRKALNRLGAVSKAGGKISQDGTKRLAGLAAQLQQVTTFGDEVTISMQSQLAAFGLTEDQVATLTPRVQDMAAAMGTDLKSSASALGRAVGGSVGSLSRYGIVLSESEKAQFKAANETGKFAIIVGKLDKAVGGAAREVANTSSGAMAQFGNAVGDLNEELGFLLERDLAGFFRGATRVVEMAIESFAGLSDETKSMIAKVARLSVVFLGVTTALTAIAAVLPSIIAGFKAMRLMAAGAAAPLLTFVLIAVAAAAVAGTMRKAWEDNLGGIREKADSLGEFMGELFGFVQETAGEAADFLQEAFGVAFRFFAGAATLLPKLWLTAIELILRGFEKLIAVAIKAAEFLGLDGVAAKMKGAAGAVAGIRASIQGIGTSIDLGIDNLEETLNPVKIIKTAAKFWSGPESKEAVKAVGEAIKNGADFAGSGLELLLKDVLGEGGLDMAKAFFKKMKGLGGVPAGPPSGKPPPGGKAPPAGKFPPSGVGITLPPPATGVGGAVPSIGGAMPSGTPQAEALKQVIAAVKAAFDKFLQVVRIFDARLADALAFAAPVFLAAAGAAAALMVALGTVVAALLLAAPAIALFAIVFAVPIAALLLLNVVVVGLIAGILFLAFAIPALIGAVFGLAAIFLFLTRETESFKRFQAAFQAAFDKVITALEPFFENLFPLVGLFSALIDVVVLFAAAFANTAVMAEIMFGVFKFGALVMAGFLVAVGFTQNALLTMAAAFLDFAASIPGVPDSLHDVADAALAMKVDTGELIDAFKDLKDLTIEAGLAEFERLDALGDKASETSEELVNLPAGFKIAAARFRAASGEGAAAAGGGGSPLLDSLLPGEASRSVGIENVDTLVVEGVTDIESLIDQIMDQVVTRTFEATGSVMEKSSMFSRAGD